MTYAAIVFASGFTIGACATPATDTIRPVKHPALLAAVDRTLTSGKNSVVLQSDGRVTGTGIEGTWWEQDRKYCRTLTKPARIAGTECQVVNLSGTEITFDNQDGRRSTWTMQ